MYNLDIIIIILLLLIFCISTYIFLVKNKFIEGLTNTEAINNIASLYNSSNMILSNLTVTGNSNVSGNVNVSGGVTATNFNTPAGLIDIAPSTTLNANGSNGCHYVPITYTATSSGKTFQSWPTSWGSGGGQAFCARGEYMAGLQNNISVSDTTYNGFNILCCPFIPPAK